MLKIGISPGFEPPNPNRPVLAPKYLSYVVNDMIDYLRRPGVLPIMIPSLSRVDLEEFIGEMDGIVLQGGTDVQPKSYKEAPIGRWLGDSLRDELELLIIDIAMKLNKPIFGICRGAQILNVYFGGTLYQDIPTQVPTAIQHRDGDLYDQHIHEIVVSPNGYLYGLNQGKEQSFVNSIHHQAIKDLGKDLKVLARSEADGIIEAFCWTGAKEGRVMAVQWHPEFNANYQGTSKLFDAEAIYTAFLKHCEK